jgi:hypothetical protein
VVSGPARLAGPYAGLVRLDGRQSLLLSAALMAFASLMAAVAGRRRPSWLLPLGTRRTSR